MNDDNVNKYTSLQNSSSVAQLVPSKSDYDIAQELKQEMIEASKITCAVLDKAVKLGFQMSTQFGPNQVTGKFSIVQCVVSKVF